jgi:hypothetical protein
MPECIGSAPTDLPHVGAVDYVATVWRASSVIHRFYFEMISLSATTSIWQTQLLHQQLHAPLGTVFLGNQV